MHYNTPSLGIVKNDWALVRDVLFNRCFGTLMRHNVFIINELYGASRRVLDTMGKVPIRSDMQYYSEFETRSHNLGLQA